MTDKNKETGATADATACEQKPLPYRWGQALAVFDAVTPDGLSPFAMNNAVERPLTSLPSLTVKARSKDQGLQKRLAEHMAGLGCLT